MQQIPEHAVSGAKRLDDTLVEALCSQVPAWRRDGAWLERRVKTSDFRAALGLIQAVGELAEAEDHHPDFALEGWNKLTFRLSTHDAGGLTLNDFVLARGIDACLAKAGID